jgi:hypothetical protein
VPVNAGDTLSISTFVATSPFAGSPYSGMGGPEMTVAVEKQ